MLASFFAIAVPILLDGRPFPAVAAALPHIPVPRRVLTATPKSDLQQLVRTLEPGDALRVPKGRYAVPLTIDASCRDGTAAAPIQILFDERATVPGLTIRRSHWYVAGLRTRDVTIQADSVTLHRSRMRTVTVDGGRGARIDGTIIRNGGETAVRVTGARDVQIANNTILGSPTAGVVFESASASVIRGNQISNGAIGIRIDRSSKITVERNNLDTEAREGIAVGIEASADVRVANNAIQRYADAVIVPASAPGLVVVNNIILGVSRTAFVLPDPAAAKLFDYNVFSTTSAEVAAEAGGQSLVLPAFLARGTMPNTRVVAGVRFRDSDLARITNLETVDRGTSFGTASFLGSAPDLGVAERAGRPDSDLLAAEPQFMLGGQPFPPETSHDPRFPAPRRTFHVDPTGDLQAAICRLEPGDRLVVAPGTYKGPFRIAGTCRNGTVDAPIQVFATDAFLEPHGNSDVLTVERAHWQFRGVQIALMESNATGLSIVGPGAHHIAIDHTHIYEGRGAAIQIRGRASAIALSNSHIHHTNGIEVSAESSEIGVLNNHIHHNRGIAVRASGRGLTLRGNRIHNDHGGALDLAGCHDVTIEANKLWNYKTGAAVTVRADCNEVTFVSNAVAASAIPIRLEDASRVTILDSILGSR